MFLVETAADIVGELGMLAEHMLETPSAPADVSGQATSRDPDYQTLLDTMGFDPVSADELAQKSGLTIEQVSSMLLILELEGQIEAQSGGRYSRLSR